MKLLTKLGVTALLIVTVAPLAITAAPTVASAKAYKISKNVLKSKTKLMTKYSKRVNSNDIFVLTQTSAKTLKIIDSAYRDSSDINYKITSQKVNGSKMTFKLTPKLSKQNKKYGLAKGSGTLVLQRTGKNSYKIPTIYVGNKSSVHRINATKFQFQNEWNTPKKVSETGLKLMSKSKLRKLDNTNIMMQIYFK